MIAWTAARELSITTVPRPSDSPQATVAGPDKLPVLVFGAGPAVGWGVRSNDLALPGSLARALAARINRGVQVDLVAHRTMTMSNAHSYLSSVDLGRYRAVVVVFSIKDALVLTPVRRWRKQLISLLDDVAGRIDADTPVIITGIQAVRSIPAYDSSLGEIASAHARRLNQETRSVLDALGDRFVYEPLVIPAGRRSARHRESGDYVYWARTLATDLEPLLAGQSASDSDSPGDTVNGRPRRHLQRDDIDEVIDEPRRQQTVDLLRLTERSGDDRIQHLVDLARRALQADSALFGVLDNDRDIHVAESGVVLPEVPRESSLCDHAIRYREGCTVLDASADQRFTVHPWVTGESGVRFFSGFPVEAPNGQRVGALCVFDSQARTRDQVNIELLEELALLIQRELWRYLPEASVEHASSGRHLP